jgi:CSLREA domain-containing protein
MFRTVVLLLSVFGFAAIDSYAATLTVTKVEDTSDGICDSDCSLREAVGASSSNDTVVFSALFNSPQTITLTSGQITIDKSLTITGTGQNLVTLSGNSASRIFLIMGVAVNISGITFRDGSGSDFGGGAIYVYGSTLTATNVTFTNNTSGTRDGGAIFGVNNSTFNLSHVIANGNASQGRAISGALSTDIQDSVLKQNIGGGIGSINLSISRCMISDHNFGGVSGVHITLIDSIITNNSTLGGVSDGDASSTISIERCLINGNSRIRPGAGIKSTGTTVIRDSQITNNTAVSGGGGIASTGTLYLLNSVVSGNTSTSTGFEDGGGGIEHSSGSLFVINSTVSGNTAQGNPGLGGGIYNLVSAGTLNGRIYLVNSTIASNTSAGAGGGIRIDPNGVGDFSNTIVARNTSTGTSQEDVSGVITSNGINLIGNPTGSSGWVAEDLLNVDAILGPLGDNGGSTFTRALLPGSPAINAGNNLLAIDPLTMLPLTQDQRGHDRVVGSSVDIGAHEALYSSSAVTVSGRIKTYSGRGIDHTRIKIDDGQGNVFYTQTNPFGYYRVNNLIPGTTYILTVTHKLYLLTSPQFFTADQDRSDLNFITGL